jgi:hypothetical protein
MAQSEVMNRHWADWSKEKNEKARLVKAVSGPRLEPGPPKYKTGVLTTRLQCSFIIVLGAVTDQDLLSSCRSQLIFNQLNFETFVRLREQGWAH